MANIGHKSNGFQLKGLAGRLIDQYLNKTLIKLVEADTFYPDSLKEFYQFHPTSVETPEIQQMSLPRQGKFLQKDCYIPPKLYTLILKNHLYSPIYDICLTKSRQIITESISSIHRTPKHFSVSNLYRKKIESLSGVHSVFRTLYNNYYHLLLDSLPRLYLTKKNTQYQDQTLTLLFSSPPNSTEQYFLDKLFPKGIAIKVVDSQKIYKLEKLIFAPFMTQPFCGFLPEEYFEFITEKLCPKRQRYKHKRIYITRKNATCRHIANEETLQKALDSYGFQCYSPEDLSLDEQIELFYDAEIVVATHGAALSNLIYSSEVKLLEIFPATEIKPFYYFLCKSKGHQYQYWCHPNNNINPPTFTVDISEILKLVEQMLE